MFSKILASVIATGALWAQGCPDTTTRVVPTDIAVGPTVDCSSLDLKIDGVQLGGRVTGCPTVLIVTPAHTEPIHDPGCMTRVVPDGQVQITKMVFECVARYFLFIKVGTTCVLKSNVIAGGLVTYKAIPCETTTKETIGR